MFMMKKNREGKFSRLVIPLIIFSALVAGTGAEKVSGSGPRINGKVKILILSKHVRLLKEGKTGSIQITVPASAEFYTGIKRIPARALSITASNNIFTVKTERDSFTAGEFVLYPDNAGEMFYAAVDGTQRSYPLPLYIKNTGEHLELSIEEGVNQFAIDSACSELGDTSESHSEALFALAHLIKARCSLPYLKNKHRGYDFCDLTCCQTYRGRSGKSFDDPVSVSTDGVRNGFFFHTSGGGRLFTESIFNARGRLKSPPKDIIYSENLMLSGNNNPSWDAAINEHELAGILYPGKRKLLKNLVFDRDREIIFVETEKGSEKVSPESFRISVNRVKGWNFIKSNNYTVMRSGDIYHFSGSGLGHGVGMSFEGALQLAEKGYSRYEILEHYYPEIRYIVPAETVNFQMQYVVFNPATGDTIRSSGGTSFRNRVIPCGSIFKLFVALYLAEKRPDLFYNYKYTCTDKENDKLMPEECWNRTGHGEMDIRRALYNSCNKYFASLYSRIDRGEFTRWISGFTVKQGIELYLPGIKSGKEFSSMLAGLDFNLKITVNGIIKLNRYLCLPGEEPSSAEKEIIFDALHKTFTEGTAKKTLRESNHPDNKISYNATLNNIWGKTGTVISGTNSHFGYGIFTGGTSSMGIVALLRKGTGAPAARESERLLSDIASETKQLSGISPMTGR